MDIEYLLGLQGLRETLGGVVENFFVGLSFIGDGPALIALACVVYWCFDKRSGQLALWSFSTCNFIGQWLKNMLCIYRPWIIDSRISPAPGAIDGATGYSFPSGHTMGSGTILGSLAWSVRHYSKVIAGILLAVFVLIAFSRNYLGVHTPQDVLVAIVLAVLMIWLSNKFLDWIEENPEYDVRVVIVVAVACVVCLVVVGVKPYAVAYDASGNPLIDVVQMQKGSFEGAGVLLGMTLGWFVERRSLGFSTDWFDVDNRERIMRAIVGIPITGITYLATDVLFKAILPYIWAKFFAMTVLMFVTTYVVPLAFTAVAHRMGQR